MKKFCINLMMLLAVTLIGICICASKDITNENPPVKQEHGQIRLLFVLWMPLKAMSGTLSQCSKSPYKVTTSSYAGCKI